MNCFAFIFARGGSKGLPRKNLKKLKGKPLIAYSIELARYSKYFDKIFVSTEDNEIAEIASSYGAEVIVRPIELASDNSPEWLSWQHAVDYVIKEHGKFSFFVSLPTTSPLRAPIDVENALDKIKSNKCDICISVTPSSRSPYFNMVELDEKGFASLHSSNKGKINRRQDVPATFDITTVVYATTPQFIANGTGVFDGRVGTVEVPKERAVDIDDIIDFKLAELLLDD